MIIVAMNLLMKKQQYLSFSLLFILHKERQLSLFKTAQAKKKGTFFNFQK